MAAQDRRRAEIVRWRQHIRLDRRDRIRHHEKEPYRGIQAELVKWSPRSRPAKDQALSHVGRYGVKIGSTDSAALLRRAGDTRACEKGNQPMNGARSKKIE